MPFVGVLFNRANFESFKPAKKSCVSFGLYSFIHSFIHFVTVEDVFVCGVALPQTSKQRNAGFLCCIIGINHGKCKRGKQTGS